MSSNNAVLMHRISHDNTVKYMYLNEMQKKLKRDFRGITKKSNIKCHNNNNKKTNTGSVILELR